MLDYNKVVDRSTKRVQIHMFILVLFVSLISFSLGTFWGYTKSKDMIHSNQSLTNSFEQNWGDS